jgi:hypothetical protein
LLGTQGNLQAKEDSSDDKPFANYDYENYTYSEGYDAFCNYVDNREDVQQSIQRSLTASVKHNFRNIATEKDENLIIKNAIIHYSRIETDLILSLKKIKLIFPFNYFW